MPPGPLPSIDSKFIQIIDARLADGAARCGAWLVCKPGCCQCCTGVFAINQLDAARLQRGIADLDQTDPARAAAIRTRSRDAVVRLAAAYPGNIETGILDPAIAETGSDAELRFAECGNDEVCPVLDPLTGQCELYNSRPMTCRTFGPPVRSEEGLGVCELCFHGATHAQIAECEIVPDPDDLETKLLKKTERAAGRSGQTIVAYSVR